MPYTEKWWFNPKTREVEFREFYVDTSMGHPTFYVIETRFGHRSKCDECVATGSVFDNKYLAHLVGVARVTEEIVDLDTKKLKLEQIKERHKAAARRAEHRVPVLVSNHEPAVEEFILA